MSRFPIAAGRSMPWALIVMLMAAVLLLADGLGPLAAVLAEAPPVPPPAATPPGREAPGAGKPRGNHASLAPAKPRSAAQKAKILSDLYERLAAAESAEQAETIAATIEQMWLYSGSDTINLLMERSLKALGDKKPEVALKLLDGVIAQRPAYAEAWNRRAYVHFTQKDFGKALSDLHRALALEPRHFKAMNGVGTILREFGNKAGALKAYRKLLEVHPFWKDAEQAVKELEREVDGDNI